MREIYKFSDEDEFAKNPLTHSFSLRFGYKSDAKWNMIPVDDIMQLKYYLRYGHTPDPFWMELLASPVVMNPNYRNPPKFFRDATDEIFWKKYMEFLYFHVVSAAVGDKEAVQTWIKSGGSHNFFADKLKAIGK